MPPPSEPTSPKSRRRGVIAALAIGVVVCAAIGYTAMHPARLLATARYVGPDESGSFAEEARKTQTKPCPDCSTPPDKPSPDSPAVSSVAVLPDGHREVTLGVPDVTDSYGDTEPQSPSAPRQLILTSDDSPSSKVVLLPKVPDEMRTLVGVATDLELVATSASLPEKPVASDGSDKPRQVALLRFGIVGNQKPRRRLLAAQPSPGAIREMALSPRGDRIVWVIQKLRKPYPIVALAAKRLPQLAPFSALQPVITLWETDGDGTNPIKLGDESQPAARGEETKIPIPADFRYSADDKHINFKYGSGDYEISSPTRR